MNELDKCLLCPRACGVNRNAGELGYCRSDAGYHIGSICIHKGEEPVISGIHGICNIFFSHCNLQCVFCQNYQISRNTRNARVTLMTLDAVVSEVIQCLDRGVEAVGFVTPSHYIPHVKAIAEQLDIRGYQPIKVYNTNSYDSVESLQSLEGIIDVYLPDLKYADPVLSGRYSGAKDYPEVARKAVLEMYRQKGSSVVLNDNGQALTGLIIRHLVLPGCEEDSIAVLKWIAAEVSPAVTISLMSQYDPPEFLKGTPGLNRLVTREEYRQVVKAMEDLGFYNGWIQEPESSQTYRPDFNRDHPFER
jgi:putative pyruvate formate lyase activating enzyme